MHGKQKFLATLGCSAILVLGASAGARMLPWQLSGSFVPTAVEEFFKAQVGTWNATVTIEPMETLGMTEPMIFDGVMTNKMALNNKWLTSEFKGDLLGQLFEGRGFDGWDAVQQKLVGVWVDNQPGSGLGLFSGELDKDGKSRVAYSQLPDPQTGQLTKVKSVTSIHSANHYSYVEHRANAAGEMVKFMSVQFKRKEATGHDWND